jgi:hypothetical protein
MTAATVPGAQSCLGRAVVLGHRSGGARRDAAGDPVPSGRAQGRRPAYPGPIDGRCDSHQLGRGLNPPVPQREQITLAMTLRRDVRFGWWLQRSGLDSF